MGGLCEVQGQEVHGFDRVFASPLYPNPLTAQCFSGKMGRVVGHDDAIAVLDDDRAKGHFSASEAHCVAAPPQP